MKKKRRAVGYLTRLRNRKLKHHREAKDFHHVRLVMAWGATRDVLLTENELIRALERANRNPEDIP